MEEGRYEAGELGEVGPGPGGSVTEDGGADVVADSGEDGEFCALGSVGGRGVGIRPGVGWRTSLGLRHDGR